MCEGEQASRPHLSVADASLEMRALLSRLTRRSMEAAKDFQVNTRHARTRPYFAHPHRAQLTGLSRSTLYRKISDGTFPARSRSANTALAGASPRSIDGSPIRPDIVNKPPAEFRPQPPCKAEQLFRFLCSRIKPPRPPSACSACRTDRRADRLLPPCWRRCAPVPFHRLAREAGDFGRPVGEGRSKAMHRNLYLQPAQPYGQRQGVMTITPAPFELSLEPPNVGIRAPPRCAIGRKACRKRQNVPISGLKHDFLRLVLGVITAQLSAEHRLQRKNQCRIGGLRFARETADQTSRSSPCHRPMPRELPSLIASWVQAATSSGSPRPPASRDCRRPRFGRPLCERRNDRETSPGPPPHKRIGRAVYIVARELPGWVESLGRTEAEEKRRRGRPTVAERMKRRDA
jgi:hypothetical protein